jgi:DnaJ-class molecular chaperone
MSDGWIDCPECEGDGFIEITRGGVDAHGPWMSIIPRRCPECHGDGEVPLDD